MKDVSAFQAGRHYFHCADKSGGFPVSFGAETIASRSSGAELPRPEAVLIHANLQRRCKGLNPPLPEKARTPTVLFFAASRRFSYFSPPFIAALQ